MEEQEKPLVEKGHPCPLCRTNNLTLMQKVVDIPFFGITYIFSMNCENPDCDYEMSDLEAEEEKKPVKMSLEVTSEEDLNIRVVKSASATIKIPRMLTISPGADSKGYVTNVEGLLQRVKAVFEELKQDDDKAVAKKAKNQLKKIQKVLWGQESLTLQLDDPTGNSAFISDKAK